MLIGYMRVSSDNNRQTTHLQRDALITTGVDERHLFEDKASGALDNRPGLAQALDMSTRVIAWWCRSSTG
jgi:DNA invertase Pin-like site-specific DNA recombinase